MLVRHTIQKCTCIVTRSYHQPVVSFEGRCELYSTVSLEHNWCQIDAVGMGNLAPEADIHGMDNQLHPAVSCGM